MNEPNAPSRQTAPADARSAAYRSLLRWERDRKYANLEIDAAIRSFGLEGRERRFFTTLVYGVIERQITLDYYLDLLVSRPYGALEDGVRMLLRLGAYQILYLDRVPDSAAVSTSVELAKRFLHRGTEGFVNGVLRNLIRRRDLLPLPADEEALLSVRYACPAWLVRLWRTDYGNEKAEALLAASLRHPGLTLRVNTLKTTRNGLIARLTEEGIPCRPTALSPDGIRLDSPTTPSELTALTEGLCFIQDEASQLCVSVLGARPGETVLDLCACPGGKSFGIAMSMEDRGRLFSFDLHESKLSLVRSGAERLGIGCLTASARDGRDPDPAFFGAADRVLCDVPCSGLGVIAKKPDLRHKDPAEIAPLPEIQYRILSSGAVSVRPGGVLVYSTCTLNRRENEAVADRFLAEHPDFSPSGEGMPFGRERITLFPDEGETDGFFIARFRRTTNG